MTKRWVSIQAVFGAGQDDLEPNDLPEQAFPILAGQTFSSFLSHSRDVDFYSIDITDTAILTVTLNNLPANYDVAVFTDLLAVPDRQRESRTCSASFRTARRWILRAV